jgi:hypothetical protein
MKVAAILSLLLWTAMFTHGKAHCLLGVKSTHGRVRLRIRWR